MRLRKRISTKLCVVCMVYVELQEAYDIQTHKVTKALNTKANERNNAREDQSITVMSKIVSASLLYLSPNYDFKCKQKEYYQK